jgi:hypothetical protein
MKALCKATTVMLIFLSCGHRSSEKESMSKPVMPVAENPVPSKQSFFPVTSYFKGQLYDIMHKGINPLKYVTIKDHTDSTWLKIEKFPDAISEFLHPEIDSLNLTTLFTEKKFMDQTIDALTFTYDPTGLLPDSMSLNHWDVYINPKTGKVKRIYLVKNPSPGQTIQLTWQGDKWCKITTISNKTDGTSEVEKEEKITWDF